MNVSENMDLALTPQDLETLNALPGLQKLHLDIRHKRNLPHLVAIARRFPALQIESGDDD